MAPQAEASLPRFRNPAHVRRVLAHCLETTQPRRFMVECRDKAGNSYFAEIDDSETSLSAIVCALIDGQYERIISIREVGTDVSEEIAKHVARHCEDFGLGVTSDVRAFLQDHGQEAPRFDEVA